MELLLNLVWLGLALACAGALLKHVQANRRKPSIWFVAAAVICIVVLLFPIISMTDDLHADLFTMEDSGKPRVAAVDIEHHVVEFIAARLLTLVMTPAHPSWRSADDELTPSSLEGVHNTVASRPPPAFSLA